MNHALPDLTSPSSCTLEAIRVRLVIKHCLIDLLLRIEDERPVLDNFLV